MVKRFCVSFILLQLFICEASKQGVTVKGKLKCNGVPLPDAKVKIFDIDRMPGDSDDLLDEGVTSSSGQFILEGYTYELGQIEPEVRIYHHCNNQGRDCRRKVIKPIPAEYIHEEMKTKVFNFGTLDVAVPFENESESCDNDEF
uniref:Transthyretin-like family protein n=2 Tax=Bursaphelenchus xylophilus TaxID=6326 RepID=A0A1I7RMQ3_BURXY